ncbi:hypothetical protein PENTCL1PPCAC_14576, partial [Pristionchus entomophagus]
FIFLIMNSLVCFALLAIGSVFCQSCVDLINPATGTSDCPQTAYLCNNPTYYSLMTVQCPKTCGRCSSPNTNTPSHLVVIFHSRVSQQIHWKSIQWPLTCVDLKNPTTGVSDCSQTAYLCNNPVYYSLMTTQCPATCGRCPTAGK